MRFKKFVKLTVFLCIVSRLLVKLLRGVRARRNRTIGTNSKQPPKNS